jgi:hypothetical protein
MDARFLFCSGHPETYVTALLFVGDDDVFVSRHVACLPLFLFTLQGDNRDGRILRRFSLL